ncbi:hypothetical protein GDO78_007779 [Eleutherodactylus coqui]|uniref:Uncharacterized protein n=1 Tax=Eleutherodactylus coqui TaxID=57060 RepID=A0A8J6FK73_ELECQ|nr:hypothetical protein GDO78_007779 [Eleutherodactylus coqui]
MHITSSSCQLVTKMFSFPKAFCPEDVRVHPPRGLRIGPQIPEMFCTTSNFPIVFSHIINYQNPRSKKERCIKAIF